MSGKIKHCTDIVGVAMRCAGLVLRIGSQTWDDNDRSDRDLGRDMGENYLNTLQ